MSVEGAETARWCSHNTGSGEVEEWTESFSYGAHEMRDGQSASKIKRMKAAVLDSEFQTLKTGEGYIKLSGYNPAKFTARKPRLDDISESYIENEKLSGLLVQEREEQEKYRIEVEQKISKGFNTEDQISGDSTKKKQKKDRKTNQKEGGEKTEVINGMGYDWEEL